MPAFAKPIPAHPDPDERSALYKLVSLGFRYPSRDMFDAFRDGSYLAELWDRLSGLPHLSRLLSDRDQLSTLILDRLEGMPYSEFEVRFAQLFDVGTPAPPCPPYEHLYREGNQANVMLQVSEFYKHFGLEMDQQQGLRDLPDHLCVELEFLHFLAFKEAQAERDGALDLLQGYRLAQKDFLERHLAQWVPRFARKLQDQSALPIYCHLGRVTTDLIDCEVEFTAAGYAPADYGPAGTDAETAGDAQSKQPHP